MSEAPANPPPGRPRTLIERSEQAVLVILAMAVVAGVAYRVVTYWRIGADPLERIPPAAATFKIDVNAANWVELAVVPGLGEVLARRIVEYRDKSLDGQFTRIEQIMAVQGIGGKKLQALRPYLVLGDGGPDSLSDPIRMLDVAQPK